jgi:hypothetical protein
VEYTFQGSKKSAQNIPRPWEERWIVWEFGDAFVHAAQRDRIAHRLGRRTGFAG